MRKYFKISLLLLLAITSFVSCKREISKIYNTGGTTPEFSINNLYSADDTLELKVKDAALPCVNLLWTNPNYQFTTGVSSQNVTYLFQADSSGNNFANPRNLFSVTDSLGSFLTVEEFNNYINALNLIDTSVAHKIDMRITSTLTNSSLPLISNVVSLWIKSYPLPEPTLYITGNALPSDWSNTPPSTQKFTYNKATQTFTITVDLEPGKGYKFLEVLGQWQPQWGGCGASGGALKENPGGGTDPDQIPTPGDAGTYKITVKLNSNQTGNCTVEKQ